MELHYIVPPEAEGQSLGLYLRTCGVTAGLIKTVKHTGQGFFADGQTLHTNQKVHAGQCVSFALPPEPATSVAPQPIPVSIVYEDEFAAVLDKPAGLAVHPTLNYPDHTLANGWIYHLKSQGKTGVFRPINRIDKNTSGLVLCAKNAFAAPMLSGKVQKCYFAIVQGSLPLGPGRVEAPIGRQGDSIIGRCVTPEGKYSLTEYTVLASSAAYSLLACTPRTGRTHQIRVHMAYLGHPLAGDTLYGGKADVVDRHMLHCGVLHFVHPMTREQIRVTSQFPKDMRELAEAEHLLSGWTPDRF